MSNIKDFIIDNSHHNDEFFDFEEFKDKSEVSEKILKDFMELYDKEHKRFPLSGNTQKFGIISDCMALSTLLELHSLEANIKNAEDIIFSLVEKIFSAIYRKVKTPTFDASPYFDKGIGEKNCKITTYTETVSKVLICMIDFRSFLITTNYFRKIVIQDVAVNKKDDLVQRVEILIIECIKTLNGSCLSNSNSFDFKINGEKIERGFVPSLVDYRGWTYKSVDKELQDKYDVSVYFTYHATNAFMSFYQNFESFFLEKYEGITSKKINNNIKDEIVEKKDRLFFEENEKLIKEFRNKTISSGRFFEHMLIKNGVDFALHYVNKDLEIIDYKTISSVQKSNDVINTLFVLNILLNAGLDDDYESVNNKSYFYEQIQFGLSNVKKIYSVLKRNNKDDIINSYSVRFDEKTPSVEKENLQYFRKHCDNLGVYDLQPLYCNTYANISKYLIKYPQREMLENLEMIANNRQEDKWLWDKYCFNINNMLYYVFAIENFYDYKTKYENPLSDNGKKYNEIAVQAQKKAEIQIRKAENLVKEKENKIMELQDKKSELDKAVVNIVEKLLVEKIDVSIKRYIQNMINDSRSLAIECAMLKNNGEEITEDILNKHESGMLLFNFCGVKELMGDIQNKGIVSLEGPMQSIMLNKLISDRIRLILLANQCDINN